MCCPLDVYFSRLRISAELQQRSSVPANCGHNWSQRMTLFSKENQKMFLKGLQNETQEFKESNLAQSCTTATLVPLAPRRATCTPRPWTSAATTASHRNIYIIWMCTNAATRTGHTAPIFWDRLGLQEFDVSWHALPWQVSACSPS